MRAAKITERPVFSLMKQTDIQNIYYMQMPRWLFSDPRYAEMTLEAKVAYTFLLNRFQLSRRKGWINDQGEVFVIFPRMALAKELRICEKRVTAAFRELAKLELIWEKRCGRGEANQIYLAKVEPMDDPDYQCAPFQEDDGDESGSRTADLTVLEEGVSSQEPQEPPVKNSQNDGSRTAVSALLEPPNWRSSKKEKSINDLSQKEISQSVTPAHESAGADGRADEEQELTNILEVCELHCFPPETARVFENAIERLFYSNNFRIGSASLPQSRVRAKLRLLDSSILQLAESKLHANMEQDIRNSTAYIMATIFNCIAEAESDLMLDPYLNSLRLSPERRDPPCCYPSSSNTYWTP